MRGRWKGFTQRPQRDEGREGVALGSLRSLRLCGLCVNPVLARRGVSRFRSCLDFARHERGVRLAGCWICGRGWARLASGKDQAGVAGVPSFEGDAQVSLVHGANGRGKFSEIEDPARPSSDGRESARARKMHFPGLAVGPSLSGRGRPFCGRDRQAIPW